MITSEKGLKDSLNFLIERSDDFNRKLDNNMNATSFNNLLKDIESRINILYEKTRVMEDVKDYIKTFVIKAIDERKNKIINKLKVIETSVDKTTNKAIVEVINLSNYSQHILDRDGEPIETLDNINGKLVLPSKVVNKETLIGIVDKGQGNIAKAEQYNEMTLNTLDNEPLAAVYEAYEPANSGIVNEYEITFETRANCNKIEFNPVNCTINKVVVTTFDGAEKEIQNNQTYLSSPIEIEKIDVSVRCNTYTVENVEYIDEINQDSFDNSFTGV